MPKLHVLTTEEHLRLNRTQALEMAVDDIVTTGTPEQAADTLALLVASVCAYGAVDFDEVVKNAKELWDKVEDTVAYYETRKAPAPVAGGGYAYTVFDELVPFGDEQYAYGKTKGQA